MTAWTISPRDADRMDAVDSLCDELVARGCNRFRSKVWLGFILIVKGWKA